LGMLDMTRVFINSGLADDLDNYFESQRSWKSAAVIYPF
jgi:hypothetical protein